MTLPQSPSIASDPHVFLVGRPPIGELLGFIRTMSIDGQAANLGALTAQWRAANDHVLQLEKDEAGASDTPSIRPLPSALTPLAEALLADPVFQKAYKFVPTELAMVDLNQLVVFQKFINLAFVEELKTRIGPSPGFSHARLAA